MAEGQKLEAGWISTPGEKSTNHTFLARKAFMVASVPGEALLHVCADMRYAVYLNGQFIGAGPARGTNRRSFYDTYEASARLRAGENHLAAIVHCPVRPVTMAVPPVMPALWLQLGSLVQTDPTWQVQADPAHIPKAPFYTHHIGFSDYRDLRRELAGWEVFSDAADGWTAAVEVAPADGLGGRRLVPRDIPPLASDCVRPSTIVGQGAVPAHAPDIEGDLEYARLMQEEPHYPSRRLASRLPLTVSPESNGSGSYVLFDFGREVCGHLVLDLEGPAGTIVDVGYDEVVVDGRINPLQINPNLSVYRYADRYILRKGRQRIENRLQERGFRIMQLTARRYAEPVRVHAVEVSNRLYPARVTASFESDDPFLNRLWQICRDTVLTCCLDVFVDCPWREQTLWVDDQPFESLYYLELTGDPVFPARNLRLGADGAREDGLIPARYPSPSDMWFRSMSALWTIILSDYHLHTADRTLLAELLPVMDRALSVYDTWREEDGLVGYEGGEWNFTDWGYDLSGVFMGGKAAVLNMLIAVGYQRAADLHEAIGDDAGAAEMSRKATLTARAVRDTFWLSDEQRFYDCTAPREGRRTYSQLPHALGLAHGLLEADLVTPALQALLAPDVIRAQYGFAVYVLRALAEHGQAEAALGLIHQMWGHVVASGSPNLWEVMQGRAARINGQITAGSLCHGYAAAPIDFLQRTMLGVRPLKAGFAEFALGPQPLGCRWASGSVPTPHGPITVQWAEQDGTMAAEVTVPPTTTAVLANGRRLGEGTHGLLGDLSQ